MALSYYNNHIHVLYVCVCIMVLTLLFLLIKLDSSLWTSTPTQKLNTSITHHTQLYTIYISLNNGLALLGHLNLKCI